MGGFFLEPLMPLKAPKSYFLKFVSCWWSEHLRPKIMLSSVRVVLPPFWEFFQLQWQGQNVYTFQFFQTHEGMKRWCVERLKAGRCPWKGCYLWGGFPQVLSSASVALRALHKQLRPGEVMDTSTNGDFGRSYAWWSFFADPWTSCFTSKSLPFFSKQKGFPSLNSWNLTGLKFKTSGDGLFWWCADCFSGLSLWYLGRSSGWSCWFGACWPLLGRITYPESKPWDLGQTPTAWGGLKWYMYSCC